MSLDSNPLFKYRVASRWIDNPRLCRSVESTSAPQAIPRLSAPRARLGPPPLDARLPGETDCVQAIAQGHMAPTPLLPPALLTAQDAPARGKGARQVVVGASRNLKAFRKAALAEHPLTDWQSIEHLNLSHQDLGDAYQATYLQHILGVQCQPKTAPQLLSIDLGHNRIESLSNMYLPHIQKLYMQGNSLESFKALPLCPRLEVLSIDSNQIETLQGLERFPLLRVLSVRDNPVATSFRFLERCVVMCPVLDVCNGIPCQALQQAANAHAILRKLNPRRLASRMAQMSLTNKDLLTEEDIGKEGKSKRRGRGREADIERGEGTRHVQIDNREVDVGERAGERERGGEGGDWGEG
ncbi:hypothetical protein KIPB_001490 [Kipferlia bialata]|uniref:Uncharacterized protein n=1 Tax=Kipferlia bialata TaxID=797122 RepID=A0A9K3CS20_9EUKA|nr:hypothetical protein KIPB_000165 [Kipferlia bialata]GIQ80564.1 hypothetical protein KIPB_001389 [Kipferlia bialata]GIQ80659.1 hypothetical protein KIPB_001490 [Kipferlia bialata]|eukprot:g165.t1